MAVARSSDLAGQLAITDSAAAVTQGIALTFITPYANAPFVTISAANADAATKVGAGTVIVASTTTGFTVGFTGTNSGVASGWNYHVIGL